MASQVLGTDMFQAMSTYVRDYQDAFRAAQDVNLPGQDQVDNVVLTGMGGSGIGANLAAALVKDVSPRPVIVLKDYHLPKWVNGRSLVVATSYSGETEETLYCLATAKERGSHVVGISSGGSLIQWCKARKVPHYEVAKNRQPRAALPLLFGATAGMLSRLGLGRLDLSPEDENILSNRHVQLQPRIAAQDDDALRYAEHIHKTRPTIYGEGHLWPVAVRWKCQFNENTKIFARAEQLPEANHNDLVAWAHGPREAQDLLVTLRRPNEPKEVHTRFEFLTETARDRGFPVIASHTQCRTPLGQMLEQLMVGDYTSVYAAILRNVDPTPVDVITSLKRRLQAQGLAAEARRRLGL